MTLGYYCYGKKVYNVYYVVYVVYFFPVPPKTSLMLSIVGGLAYLGQYIVAFINDDKSVHFICSFFPGLDFVSTVR